MNEVIANELIKLVCQTIYDIHGYIGTGIGNIRKIDEHATKRFDDIQNIFNNENINVLSIEGERDGIFISELQKLKSKQKIDVQIAVDPLDGTKTFSLGGSRSFSVLAVDTKVEKIYKKIPDQLSCFCVSSNHDEEFLQNIDLIKNNRNLLRKSLKKQETISTLRRQESEELWCYLLGVDNITGIEGETNFYMPSMLVNNIYMAGDSSIPLFLESDNFIGRVGASEAMIESQLWKYWNGIIVSGKKMKSYKDGSIEYLKRRILGTYNTKSYDVKEFFELDELEQLYNCGWKNDDILKLYSKDEFSPDYDLVVIGSITGTLDSKLSSHSRVNLERLYYGQNNILRIQSWIKYNELKGIVYIYYNVRSGEILWNLKNI